MTTKRDKDPSRLQELSPGIRANTNTSTPPKMHPPKTALNTVWNVIGKKGRKEGNGKKQTKKETEQKFAKSRSSSVWTDILCMATVRQPRRILLPAFSLIFFFSSSGQQSRFVVIGICLPFAVTPCIGLWRHPSTGGRVPDLVHRNKKTRYT